VTTQDLIQYYCSLLVLQYANKPKAVATIGNVVSGVVMPDSSLQQIGFGPKVPASGTFTLSYGTSTTSALAYNASASDIQTALRLLPGLSEVLVTGSVALQSLNVAMVAVPVPVSNLTAVSALMDSAGNGVAISVGGLGNTLPTAVQNGFNLNPTVQTLTLSDVPASGSFALTYQGNTSSLIDWNASADAVLKVCSAFFGTSAVSIVGVPLTEVMTLTFNINTIPSIIGITSNTLANAAAVPVTITAATNQAVGVQLDIVGKYTGVTRSGFGAYGPITLNDADFAKLIQLAIVTNSAGSSLATIQQLLHQFFPGEITVFDAANTAPMQMTYYVNSAAFSQNLLQLFISEGLLPRPMGVGIAAIAPPSVTKLYGWCDYDTATPTQPNTVNTVGMNCATSYTLADYNTTWPYMDYKYSLV
jgi:Protein of unknown function (DUF2612)